MRKDSWKGIRKYSSAVGFGWSLVAGLVCPLASLAAVTTRQIVVDRVVDGDTVHGKDAQGKVIKVRMQGMDAPESHLPTDHGMVGQQPWGDASSNSLSRTIPKGTRLELLDFGKDKYGRTLGHLIENGRNVNVEQVRKGQAVSYIICDSGKCTEQALEEIRYRELQDACHRAEKSGLGIFDPAQPLRELPFEFRLRMQNRKADKYVGNLATQEYVSPERYREVPVCDRIFFMTEKDARGLGYRRVP